MRAACRQSWIRRRARFSWDTPGGRRRSSMAAYPDTGVPGKVGVGAFCGLIRDLTGLVPTALIRT